MKKSKQKGFTLIELLVVVAIIGILAAVGIVAFNGFIGNAKKNTAVTNHSGIVRYLTAEFAKCSLGDSHLQYTGTAAPGIACSASLSTGHLPALITHLASNGFNNPYATSEQAAYNSAGNPGTIGETNIQCAAKSCTLITYTYDNDAGVAQLITDIVAKE